MNRLLSILLISFFALSACGQKGPLYLPETEPSVQAATLDPAPSAAP